MKKTLAIIGDSSNNKQLYNLFVSLGANITEDYKFTDGYFYYIMPNGEISGQMLKKENSELYSIYSLEDFEKKFKFKIGDGAFFNGDIVNVIDMYLMSDNVYYGIEYIENGINVRLEVSYDVLSPLVLNKNAIETLNLENNIEEDMKEEVVETKEEKINTIVLPQKEYKDKRTKIVLAYGYKIENVDGEYYITRKYPMDIIDCCDILEIPYDGYVVEEGYMHDCFTELRKLTICIDAFDKLFEGEYSYVDKNYVIVYQNGEITTLDDGNYEYFLSFYTSESRDYFLNTFRKSIEKCSRFLYNNPNTQKI